MEYLQMKKVHSSFSNEIIALVDSSSYLLTLKNKLTKWSYYEIFSLEA
jgi:hypothetical protein